ncbi:MAG: PEP-CTERM sorting domain-containing protein [Pirellulales bacterium]
MNSTLDVTGITAGTYALSATQTLSGTGSILNAGKTLTMPGVISPGNSAGTLNVSGGLTMAGTTTTVMEVTGPSAFDRLIVGGALTYDGTLNIVSTETSGSFDLFDFGSLAGDYDAVTVSGFGALANAGGVWSASSGGVTATFTGATGVLSFAAVAVPEPGTWALFACGLLGLAIHRVRRKAI